MEFLKRIVVTIFVLGTAFSSASLQAMFYPEERYYAGDNVQIQSQPVSSRTRSGGNTQVPGNRAINVLDSDSLDSEDSDFSLEEVSVDEEILSDEIEEILKSISDCGLNNGARLARLACAIVKMPATAFNTLVNMLPQYPAYVVKFIALAPALAFPKCLNYASGYCYASPIMSCPPSTWASWAGYAGGAVYGLYALGTLTTNSIDAYKKWSADRYDKWIQVEIEKTKKRLEQLERPEKLKSLQEELEKKTK